MSVDIELLYGLALLSVTTNNFCLCKNIDNICFNLFNISVILPLHSSKIRDFDEFFKKAITSITTQKVLPKEVVIVDGLFIMVHKGRIKHKFNEEFTDKF